MNPLGIIRSNLLACVLGLAAAIFLVISVWQSVEINGFLWIDGLRDEIEDCARDRNELRAIAKAKNEQAKRTEGNIRESEKQQHISDKAAERIETAPLPGECRTPDAILNSDI